MWMPLAVVGTIPEWNRRMLDDQLFKIYTDAEKVEDALKAIYDLGYMHGKQRENKPKKRHGIKGIK